MTRKDFRLIADVLAKSRPPRNGPGWRSRRTQWVRVVAKFEAALAAEIKSFNREIFIDACYAGEEA